MAAIFVIVMGVARDCGRLPSEPKTGFSGGDTLDIAVIYGPGSYYIYSDSIAGINHEIAQQFSKQTGTPIKIWGITDPATGMEKLETGAFDIVASLPLDNYIRTRYPISESVFLDRLVLVQSIDTLTGQKTVNSSLDLNGKEVAVTKGSSALQRMENLAEEIGGNIVVTEQPDLSDELLTLKVANGSIPFAIVNEKPAKKISETYPNLNYDSSISFTQFQVWIFNPNDTTAAKKFNEWFDGFRGTEDYQEIIMKY